MRSGAPEQPGDLWENLVKTLNAGMQHLGTDKPWLNRQGVDWTWGCISIDNDNVRDLASLVYIGTPVLIED